MILALHHRTLKHCTKGPNLLVEINITLRHQHQLLSRDLKFLDRFPEDLLGETVGIHVCGIPGVDAPVPGGLED